MYTELTAGYHVDPERLINGAIFDIAYSEMVVVKDIPFYSLCEHHLLPFFGTAAVAYIPRGRVIGLSKIPRIVEMYARRLQVQERLTQQIAEFLQERLEPQGVGVVLEATHLCAVMRGVRKPGTIMTTSYVLGLFRTRDRTRAEFFAHLDRRAAGSLTWTSGCATESSSSRAPAAGPDRPWRARSPTRARSSRSSIGTGSGSAAPGAGSGRRHRRRGRPGRSRSAPTSRSTEQVEAMVEQVAAELGAVGVLVTATSAYKSERFAEIDDESWASVVDDLLGATFRACRAVVPGMQEAGWGRIVNIAARSGLVGRRPVDPLRRGQGRDHRPDRVAGQGARPEGILVNAVAPTTILTVKDGVPSIPDERAAEMAKTIPLRRLATPDDLAALVVWLGSAANTLRQRPDDLADRRRPALTARPSARGPA